MSQQRRWARRFAVQAVYQWQMTAQGSGELEAQFREADEIEKADFDYFLTVLRGVIEGSDQIDAAIGRYADRKLAEIDAVERAVLRIATFELFRQLDVPYRVIINEAVELAKRYGAEQGHRYINGLLDKIAAELRAPEVKAAGTR